MADEKTSQGTPAPAQPTTEQQPAEPTASPPAQPSKQPEATPAQPVAAQQQQPEADLVSMPKAAFNERLASAKAAERRALLDEFGITDPNEIKTLLEQKRQREDEQKTLEQRLAERDAALLTAQQQSQTYLDAIKQRAELEMGLLTDSQRKAVVDVAGEDHTARLRTIDALWPTWNTQQQTPAQASSQATQQPAEAQPATPVQTAPAPSAPSPSAAAGEIDHRARYQELERNPFVKARYGAKYARDVYKPSA